ncbi:MAG: hypothetical protein IKE43_05940 [Coriobacteriales bacterium]|nr:hypothetical protein [Coriobacteriales bacterium]
MSSLIFGPSPKYGTSEPMVSESERTLPDSVYVWTERRVYNEGQFSHKVTREYDKQGNLVYQISVWQNAENNGNPRVWNYEYNEDGVITGIHLDGSGTDTPDIPSLVIYDEFNAPTYVEWFNSDEELDCEWLEYYPNGLVAVTLEIDTYSESGSTIFYLKYDENGYPTEHMFEGIYRDCVWEFDADGNPLGFTTSERYAGYLDADAMKIVDQARNSTSSTKSMLESVVSPDGAALWTDLLLAAMDNPELVVELEKDGLIILDLPNGGAFLLPPEASPDTTRLYTCKTDKAGNIIAVYDQNGTVCWEVDFELATDPTPWAMYWSTIGYNLSMIPYILY